MSNIKPFVFYLDDEDGDREYSESNRFSDGRTDGHPLYSKDIIDAIVAENIELRNQIAEAQMHLFNGAVTNNEAAVPEKEGK